MQQRLSRVLVPVAVLALMVVGCSKNSDSESSSSTDDAPTETTTTLASTGDPVADADLALEPAFAGTYRQPPDSGPAAVADQKVFIISCSQVLETCKVPSDAALEAAEAIGWDAQIVDGQLSDEAQAEGITQAVAAGADGIVLMGIDCAKVQAPLARARDEGVRVVAPYAFDCDDPLVDSPGDPLFDAAIPVGDEYPAYRDVAKAFGEVKADYIIAQTDGQAKVIDMIGDDYLVMQYIEEGFASGMEACEDCEVVEEVNFVQADLLSGKLRDNLAAAMERHPEATVVHAPADPLFALAVNAATEGADVLRVGGEGLPSNMDLIRDGQQDAAVAFPHEWTGWASIDTLNRLFDGTDPADLPDSGIGWQIVDADHNLPDSGPYVPQVDGEVIDFRAAYEQVWGV